MDLVAAAERGAGQHQAGHDGGEQDRHEAHRSSLDGCICLDEYMPYQAYSRPMAPSHRLLSVLAEPTRLRILDVLLDGPRPVGELVDALGVTQPATSKHLRVLRAAGLVHVHPDAQRRVYALRPEGLAELDAWLAPYRRLWEGRLDALEAHLDANPDPGRSPA